MTISPTAREETTDASSVPAQEAKALTLSGHLEELRERLIKSLIGVGIATVLSFFFTDTIFEVLRSRAEGVQLIRTQVTEMLSVYFKVAFIGGLFLAMPVIVYQAVMFVAPALTPKEKRYLYLLLPGVTFSFLAGVAFAYFLLLPPALRFLLHFGEDIATPLIKVGDYVSVVTTLLFWVGLAFETPLVIFLLARIGVVTPQLLARNRAYAVVAAFVLAAVITPTFDPINQTLVAVPIILLYELGILLARLAWRKDRTSA